MELLGQKWKFKYSKKLIAGAGTQTAALAFGGQRPYVEEYGMELLGQRWSLVKTRDMTGAGTQTAALVFGGYEPTADSTYI